MPLAARLLPGSLFAGDFRVIDLLAEGGMSTLYRVEQLSTHKARALKLLHARIAADPRGRQRFIREATVGAAIASEHVVEVIAAGIEDATDQPWLAMELLDGADLGSLVEHRGPLDPAQAIVVLRQLCHGLGAAHRAGVVHRDLKPANIFVARSLRAEAPFTVKILDFGIAKLVEAGKSGATETETVGSPMWMAPEQLNAQRPTPATDIWALGLIAFWALTGRHYWRAAHLRDSTVQALFVEQLFKPLDAASERAAELGVAERLPEGFDAWFRRCLAREPERRFADAEAAIAGLAATVPVSETTADLRADLGALLPSSPIPPSTSAAAAALEHGPTDPRLASDATQRDVDERGAATRPSSAAGDRTLGADEPLGADLSRADLDPRVPPSAPTKRRARVALITLAVAVPALVGGGLAWAFTIGPLSSARRVAIARTGPDVPTGSETPEGTPSPDPPPDGPPRRVPSPDPPIPPPVPDDTPKVELVVPQREQPSFAARDFRMIGWAADSRRFALQSVHVDEDAGDDTLELVQVHDTLTGAMVESYVVGRAGRLRGRHLGKLRRLADQAKPFAEWEVRKEELALQPPNARHAPPGGATLVIETEEAPPPTAISARATDRGFLFRWDGVPALVALGDERTRGPHMRTIFVDGDVRWELLDIRPPFSIGQLAARADASGSTPAVVGRIDMYWSPDERRVLMLTEARPRPTTDDDPLRDARWFMRAAGPQIRIVEAGAGQRLAREVARTLEAEGLPTAAVDLREPVVEHSEIYVRRGWPGAPELGKRIAAAIDHPLTVEEVRSDGWTTAVVVLGHDLAE